MSHPTHKVEAVFLALLVVGVVGLLTQKITPSITGAVIATPKETPQEKETSTTVKKIQETTTTSIASKTKKPVEEKTEPLPKNFKPK